MLEIPLQAGVPVNIKLAPGKDIDIYGVGAVGKAVGIMVAAGRAPWGGAIRALHKEKAAQQAVHLQRIKHPGILKLFP
jgi:hypothetical protein